MADEKNRERELFSAALDMAPEERAVFLRKACRGDSLLYQRVLDLLEFDQGDDRILQTSAQTLLSECDLVEGPGTQLGRFKLLEKIGEGGMGIVYMAEQREPVLRKVALKIIKIGMDTKQVIARFEAERQALAMMDHPNIAKVLDGGATESGRPYFVMELVQGLPITEFCDRNQLPTEERLHLFARVCQAIQSAHHKGVIHRDIKPSNILVSEKDGEFEPKVIDFGIAKAIHSKLTEKTLFTHFGQMIGTPAYMSPEQAELREGDVDTRTDVYSLGVLLYELLAGLPPFTSKELLQAGYREMQRIIVEEEPIKPSTRVVSMEGELKTTFAKSRRLDATTMVESFRGDLDWITMKCLEKDRSKRYGSPNELVSDLIRHLNNEPVSAAAPSFSYQFNKFHRKHKVMVRSAMIVAAVLIVATVVSLRLAFKNDQLRKDAEDAKQAESDQRVAAEKERDRATDAEKRLFERSIELENNLYVSDMLAVEDAVENNEFIRAEQLLLQHRLEPSGRDLRGFEWRFYWQRLRGEKLNSFQAHDSMINRSVIRKMRILSDGRQLMTSGQDGKIKLWNLANYELVQEWDSVGSSFEISPNEQFLCFKEHEQGLTVWDLPANQLIRTRFVTDRHFIQFKFTYDNRNLVLRTGDPRLPFAKRRVTVEDVISGDEIFVAEGFWNDFAVSPKQPFFLISGSDEEPMRPLPPEQLKALPQAYLWNYERRELVHPPVASHGFGGRFSPSGEYTAISNSDAPGNMNASVNTTLYRVAAGEKESTLLGTDFGASFSNPSTVAFSSNEEYVASSTFPRSMTIGIWEVATGERVASHTGHVNSVTAVVFHPLSDEILISTSEDKTLQYWNWREGRAIKRFTGHRTGITTLAVGNMGESVVTGGSDGSLFVWPPHVISPTDQLPYAPPNTSSPIFSSQGTYLVLGERTASSPPMRRNMVVGPGAPPPNIKRSVFATENSGRLWEVPRTEKVLGFSTDERLLLTVSTNQIVARNAATGLTIRTVPLDSPIKNLDFDRPIPRLQDLSPDGSTLMTFNEDRTIRLVSMATGATVANFDQPCVSDSVGFSPFGDKIFFASAEGMGSGGSGIWDPAENHIVWLDTSADGWPSNRLISSPDQQYVAGLCYDKSVGIWDMSTGERIESIVGTEARRIWFSPDNGTLIMSRLSRSKTTRKVVTTLKLFNTRTWRQIGELQPPPFSQWSLRTVISPDGQNLMTQDTEGNIKLIRTPSIEEIDEFIRINQAP